MREQIEAKIEDIIAAIINKPANRITLDDYTILSSELRDIRFREAQADNGKRMADFMASAFPSIAGAGNVK